MKILILFFSIAAICLFSACKKVQSNVVVSPHFMMSDTMLSKCSFYTATKKDVKNQLRLFGKIQADNKKQAHIYSIVGGNVEKVMVELGDYVKQGQVLAVVRSSEVAGFQKERLDAQNDIALAEKSLQVAQEMYAGKLASEKDVIAAKRELEKAQAEVNRIKEVYDIYHLEKGSVFKIRAPMSGFIMQKDINENEQLRADNSDVLFSIAEINEVFAMANVNESDISQIQIGYDAEVSTLSFPDEKYKGKIDKIFNIINPETKALKVRVRIPNPTFRLKPEMSATVTVKYSEQKQMVALPSASIIFDKSKNWVVVYKNKSKLETRKIEVYRQIGDTIYVLSGINEGENIISKNGIFIYDALND